MGRRNATSVVLGALFVCIAVGVAGAEDGWPEPERLSDSGLTAQICSAASRGFLIYLAAYVAAASALGVIINWLLERKAIGNLVARLVIGLVIASAAATLLVVFDPFQVDDLARCLADPSLNKLLPLGALPPGARGLCLGFAPAAALYTALVLIRVKLTSG